MTTTTVPTRTTVPVAALGAGSGLVASALTAYGAHTWLEIALCVPIILLTSALVFGVVLPRALRRESSGGTALALSIPAVLLVLPAFWAGLPFVLGLAGATLGNAGRTARSGAGKSIAAVVLGVIAVLVYVATYVSEIASGAPGFLS